MAKRADPLERIVALSKVAPRVVALDESMERPVYQWIGASSLIHKQTGNSLHSGNPL